MDHLCDEILQLIFYELADPSPLTHVSRRFYHFSQDPYIRAHYFLIHYGSTEAMYHALGRGKLVTERVLDILLSSGAHLSRYLIQIAIHHYFHTQTHFIKTQWVRNVPLRVFAYFLKLAEEKYGEIPRGKGEDDGSIFMNFLKESRLPQQMKTVTWETIQILLESYNFIPFCNRDPIMSQFPLALAIEPRLLPYAVANGFSMDYKYRDFVFRKMFERPSTSSETRTDDVSKNVRELCKLDAAMFVSRTVAGEVCMEAKINEIGYSALKQLDKSGDLRFELSTLVADLLTTFLVTRSICSVGTGDILLHLFADFPSKDPSVRLVVLVIVFIAADNLHMTNAAIRVKLEGLGLTPITRRDVFNILVNPFVERYNSVISFARQEIVTKDNGSKGMSHNEIDGLVEEVIARCLEIACKGKLVKTLLDGFPHLRSSIARLIVQKYQVHLEDIPSWEDRTDNQVYVAKLCRDFLRYGIGEVHTMESLLPEQSPKEVIASDQVDYSKDEDDCLTEDGDFQVGQSMSNLGGISQESLTTMIRHDEVTPVRSRRRIMYSYSTSDTSGNFRYPQDPLHVGKWVKGYFGAKSSVTAVFMTHAVINDNCTMLHHYLMQNDIHSAISPHVPVTLKHFQLLARLGRTPNFYLWHDIEVGAEFYFDEYDYIPRTDTEASYLTKPRVKVEAPQSILSSSVPGSSSPTNRGKKRPRRSTAGTVRSYAVPGSDDEAIVGDLDFGIDDQEKKTPHKETNLQLWIKHLTALLKTETRKYALARKRLETITAPETKIRLYKNDFVKSLKTNLRSLKKFEFEKSRHEFEAQEISSDQDDDDYLFRRTKKRKPSYI